MAPVRHLPLPDRHRDLSAVSDAAHGFLSNHNSADAPAFVDYYLTRPATAPADGTPSRIGPMRSGSDTYVLQILAVTLT